MSDLGFELNNNLDIDFIMSLAQESMFGPYGGQGICLACGEEATGCEPDARKYECDCCGKRAVYGAEEALLMLM